MRVVKSVQEMMSISNKERCRGSSIRLVPTMGALHRGHASLIEMAAQSNHPIESGPIEKVDAEPMQAGEKDVIVIVSIFVNPLQFNNLEDFNKYPNTLHEDLDICEKLKVDYVFVPELEGMYPDLDSCSDQCMVCPADNLANILEGKSRPGHFKGMLTVVCKLFNITKPHAAYFGEKDYQQLLLIKRMSRDLNIDIAIVPVATVRDDKMLPLSSRNVRLSTQQRQIAPVIYRLLIDAKRAIETKACNPGDELIDINSILRASMIATLSLTQSSDGVDQINVDYLELRCSKDLGELKLNKEVGCFECIEGCREQQATSEKVKVSRARLLTSVVIGTIKLLDNIEVLLDT